MKNFILFVAILCGGASVLFFTAAKAALQGPNWASQMCMAAGSLCSPQLPAFAAAEFVAPDLLPYGLSPCLCQQSATRA